MVSILHSKPCFSFASRRTEFSGWPLPRSPAQAVLLSFTPLTPMRTTLSLPRLFTFCVLTLCNVSYAQPPLQLPAVESSAADVSLDYAESFYTVDNSVDDPFSGLSDIELIDLYIAASQESLQRQSLDQSTLASQGSWIIQSGYAYSFDEDDLDFAYTTHTVPQPLLQYRSSDKLELRFGWSSNNI